MIVHESVGIGRIGIGRIGLGRFGQTTVPLPTSVPVPPLAPAAAPAGPAGTQTIPVVTLGPATILDKSGFAIPGVRATVRTPARILTVSEVPGGVFQMTVDRADFDNGVSILFGAPGFDPISVPAAAIICNTGTRNEYGAITSMTQNQCPFRSFYLSPPVAQAPAPAPAPRRTSRTQKYWEAAQKYGSSLMPTGSSRLTQDQSAPEMQSQQGQGQGMSPMMMLAIGGGIVVVGVAALFMLRK